jgi:hypothetical protein
VLLLAIAIEFSLLMDALRQFLIEVLLIVKDDFFGRFALLKLLLSLLALFLLYLFLPLRWLL